MKLINKLFSKQKTASIEFCQRNLDEFLKEESFAEFNQFLSQKNINYKEYECQSRCKECRQSPYALVDGKLIAAENSDELLIKLKEEVKK
ncbi:YuzB family protein [Cytobacillus firmus]|uniref:YuzB family protein n=1 Tax=Cytobacillus firmus TaxID=1399 RepID=UPI002163861B|nr:YuzB family protein [Cytobacillus firmus]MCS0671798.1 YuzB family protein [Cytobacillus firmus]